MEIVRTDGLMTANTNPWDEIKHHLATKVSTETFENWVSKTEFRESADHHLVVAVPNRATKEFMEEEYAETVQKAIRDLNLSVNRVVYEVAAVGPATRPGFFDPAGNPAEVTFAPPSSFLNPRFRFDTFVVGSSNQFAHAAAQAVAASPSRSYNPLFLYGAVGIGKTHLMHGIGRALLDNFPGMRIVYTSSERFMNEMIQCIKLDRMPLFHQHYRVRVLVIHTEEDWEIARECFRLAQKEQDVWRRNSG